MKERKERRVVLQPRNIAQQSAELCSSPLRLVSHKQKGARARWQFVYQIYLPAIDTIGTGMLQSRNILQQSAAQAPLCAVNTGGGSSFAKSKFLKVVPKLTPGLLQVFSQAKRAETTSPICLCAVNS